MLEIRNIQLYNGAMVNINIVGTKIARVEKATGATQTTSSKAVIDATGLMAIPEVIDPHVHSRIFGYPHKENWQTLTRAAFKDGVTTVFDMPNTRPPLTSIKRLEQKRRFLDEFYKWRVQTYFWIGATEENLKEIKSACREPDVIGIKVYLGSSTGNLLVTNEETLKQIFSLCAKENKVVGVHCEDEALIKAKREALGRIPTIADHSLIRDTEVEVSAVKKALRLAEDTGCKLYLCHLSTPESVELALEAKDRGVIVYIEVTPHHIILDESKLKGPNAGYFKINPPLRSREQAVRLRKYVFDGNIDVIGSDHAPHTKEEKERENYDDVPSGVPGVETSLMVLLNLVSAGEMTLERLVALTSENAAKIFGLKNKGKIAEGFDADLVLINPEKEVIIYNSDIRSKCGWTPYDGLFVKGVPVITIMAGTVVYGRNLISNRLIRS